MTTIVEATGYAGTGAGPALPLIELAMQQAVLKCMADGIADDTPAEEVERITGVPGQTGADYIRNAKLAARQKAKDDYRALVAAHESAQAGALHADWEANQ